MPDLNSGNRRMHSLSSDIESTTYSQDENIDKYLRKKRDEALLQDDQRKKTFEEILELQEHEIFHIPGVKMIRFTHTKIKFSFQPSLIYHRISETYIFYCSLRYLKTYGKWIVKREPMPAKPIFHETSSMFIEDDLTKLYQVILKICLELKKWSKDEIRYRQLKYERYCQGELSYLDIDSVDEELHFSESERKALFEQRQKVLKRMLQPLPRETRGRKLRKIKYII